MIKKAAVIVFCLVGPASCMRTGGDPDTLHVILAAPPPTLDPRKALDAGGMRLGGLIFNGFVKLGPNLTPVGDGAKSWTRDRRTYEFFLKKLVFSNGRKVQAEDVEFSLQEFLKKESFFYSAFKNVDSFQVLKKNGGIAVKIRLKKPSAVFLSSNLPVIKILPKKESAKKDFYKNPIGSGPFQVEKNFSHQILLQRRVAAKGLPSRISFWIVRDSFTRVQKMLSGEGDIAPSVIPFEKIHFLKQKGFQVEAKTGLSTTYLLLNLKNKHLKDLKIRKAMAHLIPRKKIIQRILKNYASSAQSLLAPENQFFNPQLRLPSYNVQKSLSILPLQGAPLQLSFHCSNNVQTQDMAKILVSEIQKGNFRLHLHAKEWGAFYQDIQHGLFDIALMKWVGIVDPDIYRLSFHSKNHAPRGRNRSFYSNSGLDRLLDQGVGIMDGALRKALYRKVQTIAANDLVIIPLWHEKEVSVVKNSVRGYVLPDSGDFSGIAKAYK